MGEAGEGAEVFKNLFGGFSGSLSLFTNNPYQRGNTTDVPAEKVDSKESLKKGKLLTSVKGESEPIVHVAEKKKKKKNNENDNGAPDAEKSIAIVLDGNEGVKSMKKKKKKGLVADDTGDSNINAPESAKEPGIVNNEKEKRSKRKVVEEEIQEEFEKKFRGSDGKKAKSEAYEQNVHSEDPEIDNILQEEDKVCFLSIDLSSYSLMLS